LVEEVGEGVTNVKPGDRVAYARKPGAYSEASLVRADSLIPLPEGMSFEQGAAFPLQGMTAHYLIHEYRKPSSGDVVLIHAAAGGMGLLLVQWARHLGARVIGAVSTEKKVEAARQAGATDVILYTEQDFGSRKRQRSTSILHCGTQHKQYCGREDRAGQRRSKQATFQRWIGTSFVTQPLV
jgi:NADPH2:quinone reductase